MAPYYQFMEQSLTEKLCRTCLRMPEKLFSLFEDQKLGMMIKTISNIQVNKSMSLLDFSISNKQSDPEYLTQVSGGQRVYLF